MFISATVYAQSVSRSAKLSWALSSRPSVRRLKKLSARLSPFLTGFFAPSSSFISAAPSISGSRGIFMSDTSQGSLFIAANSQTTVQNVLDRLDIPHSFALEARVRGISSKDLMVSVLETDEMPAGIGPDTPTSDSSTRRALERLLQLLSDPICGRR